MSTSTMARSQILVELATVGLAQARPNYGFCAQLQLVLRPHPSRPCIKWASIQFYSNLAFVHKGRILYHWIWLVKHHGHLYKVRLENFMPTT